MYIYILVLFIYQDAIVYKIHQKIAYIHVHQNCLCTRDFEQHFKMWHVIWSRCRYSEDFEEFEINFTLFLISLQFFGMVLAIHPFGWVLLASQSCVFFFGVFVSRLAVIISWYVLYDYLSPPKHIYTLQGTNISPQKASFEDVFPFPKVGYVSFQEGKWPWIFRLSQVTT